MTTNGDWSTQNKSVFSYYVRSQRGTARIRTPLLQQSIYISWPPGPQQQTCSSGVRRPSATDRQTDARPLHKPHSVFYAESVNNGIIYKSLFTENSVATQKQYSTSINTKQKTNITMWYTNASRRLKDDTSSLSQCHSRPSLYAFNKLKYVLNSTRMIPCLRLTWFTWLKTLYICFTYLLMYATHFTVIRQ